MRNKSYKCEWAIKYGYELQESKPRSLILTATVDLHTKKVSNNKYCTNYFSEEMSGKQTTGPTAMTDNYLHLSIFNNFLLTA